MKRVRTILSLSGATRGALILVSVTRVVAVVAVAADRLRALASAALSPALSAPG
jgi:hypothetical protein